MVRPVIRNAYVKVTLYVDAATWQAFKAAMADVCYTLDHGGFPATQQVARTASEIFGNTMTDLLNDVDFVNDIKYAKNWRMLHPDWEKP
jgi:hypothetical protein